MEAELLVSQGVGALLGMTLVSAAPWALPSRHAWAAPTLKLLRQSPAGQAGGYSWHEAHLPPPATPHPNAAI